MSKKSNAAVANTTPAATLLQERGIHPQVMEQPASNDSLNLAGYNDEQLHELLKSVLAESKRRKEQALALLPKAGDTVRISAKKFNGLTGTVAKAGKTRAWVTIEGQPIPVYLSYSEITVENASA